jgi:hypothetical protein
MNHFSSPTLSIFHCGKKSKEPKKKERKERLTLRRHPYREFVCLSVRFFFRPTVNHLSLRKKSSAH